MRWHIKFFQLIGKYRVFNELFLVRCIIDIAFPSVRLSVCLSVCPSVCLSVCPSVCNALELWVKIDDFSHNLFTWPARPGIWLDSEKPSLSKKNIRNLFPQVVVMKQEAQLSHRYRAMLRVIQSFEMVPFERLCMVSYSPSIITMALSCIIS